MKKNKLISAIIFGVLAVIQMFTLTFVWQNVIAQVPLVISFEIIALAVYVLTCLKLLKTAETDITCPERRTMIALTVFYFLFIALNYAITLNVIAISLSSISQELAATLVPSVIVLIVRCVILIAAVFVAVLPTKESFASIEFDEAIEPEKLITAEAVEAVINQLDDTAQ